MFLRKLCRNTVGPDPNRSVLTNSAGPNSLRKKNKTKSCGNLLDTYEYNESSEVLGSSVRRNQYIPVSPPPSYSSRYVPAAEQATREDLYVGNSGESNNTDEQRNSSLNGAYCPDILHACSLILPSQQYEECLQANSLSRCASLSSVEYAEIDEICNEFSKIRSNDFSSLPSNHQEFPAKEEEERCLASSLSGQAMGQNLSLRRPRISLTWVLREQHPQPTNSNVDSDLKLNVEKQKVKSKSKSEKLFSEKYVESHNLQEFQEKREPSKELLFDCTPVKQAQLVFPLENQRATKLNFVNAQSKREEYIDKSKSLKGTYSEPSLIAGSEGIPRRHRHRKRRDRNRSQKFGYEIQNVDEFLSKCSLSSPGNIPVVLSSSSTLYQTRPGGYQIEIPLPLGMVVNAVFKNRDWLYVQTPHAEEGYVGYASCLPLGILPPLARTTPTSRPTPCWENTGDVFPRPCGNMTDSEKEIRLRRGTRSEGARTPRPRKNSTRAYGEHYVDKLYLRAASQPRLMEKSFAQLKPTNTYTTSKCSSNEAPQQHKTKVAQKHVLNGGLKSKSLRQELVAITDDYFNHGITVKRGEIVTLLERRDTKDQGQWFYIQKREGLEGFIPAAVAGHGFL